MNFGTNEETLRELGMVHFFFLLKVLDLLDTVFIVLKKSSLHLSFLHCYHHFFMVLGTFVSIYWFPGGHFTMLGIVNSLVHAIMYFYYFLAAINPDIKKSTMLKRQVTHIQLVTRIILNFVSFAVFYFLIFPFIFRCNLVSSWFISCAQLWLKIVIYQNSGFGFWSYKMLLCLFFSPISIEKLT